MKKIFLFFIFLCFMTAPAFSQMKFSDETKKYIEYNDTITVLQNALLIDGKGNDARSNQTIIIRNGKIDWVGDDDKIYHSQKGKRN